MTCSHAQKNMETGNILKHPYSISSRMILYTCYIYFSMFHMMPMFSQKLEGDLVPYCFHNLMVGFLSIQQPTSGKATPISGAFKRDEHIMIFSASRFTCPIHLLFVSSFFNVSPCDNPWWHLMTCFVFAKANQSSNQQVTRVCGLHLSKEGHTTNHQSIWRFP